MHALADPGGLLQGATIQAPDGNSCAGAYAGEYDVFLPALSWAFDLLHAGPGSYGLELFASFQAEV